MDEVSGPPFYDVEEPLTEEERSQHSLCVIKDTKDGPVRRGCDWHDSPVTLAGPTKEGKILARFWHAGSETP